MPRHGKGALYATLLSLIMWLLMLMGGCAPRKYTVRPEGTVIDKDGSRVLIIFQDISGEPHTFTYNWFFFERADTIQVGEQFKLRKEVQP
ncbi:hypothetical protein DN752_17990 [Echinicola strongylocentroti]|uniref:Uncharacterized protein n=1 Tax=Echinicola strongylocentroti TaxID=1795355 RepID=A0A2Z4IL87_9BACT|nr:hypothetical protein [Echinicola strongylocentroti]AWW31872.1 hypothetical protein DN752_17990 [Echinicola strongylocentroti]